MQALSVAQLVLPAGAGLALLSSPGLPSSGSPWWSGLEAVAPYCSLDCFHSQGKTSGFPISCLLLSHTARSLKACPLVPWPAASTAHQVLSDFSGHWSPISGHLVCGQQHEAEPWFLDWVVILVLFPEQQWGQGLSCPICRVGLNSVSSCRGPRTGRKTTAAPASEHQAKGGWGVSPVASPCPLAFSSPRPAGCLFCRSRMGVKMLGSNSCKHQTPEPLEPA